MLIRVLGDNSTYVDDHTVPVTRDNSRVVLPIRRGDIDMDTLTMSDDIIVDTTPISVVTTDTHQVTGELMEYTDAYAVVRDRGTSRIVRGYKGIDKSLLITGIPVDEPMGSQISLSYVTSAIGGHVVHRLYSDGQLISYLNIVNNGVTDITGTEIEVMTAQQVSPMAMRTASFSTDTSEGGDIGTIYRVPGTHTIPAGHRISVPIIDTEVDMEPVYVLDAPSGRDNALYTLHWQSPVDVPPGKLLAYRDDILISRNRIPMVGRGMDVDISILEVPNIYAVGTISKNDSGRVVLRGVMYNKGDDVANVVLRYHVGNRAVSGAIKKGEYAVFPYVLDPDTHVTYDYTIHVSSDE